MGKIVEAGFLRVKAELVGSQKKRVGAPVPLPTSDHQKISLPHNTRNLRFIPSENRMI